MGQNKFNGMTASERVQYAHGRTASDIQFMREQIIEMYRLAIFERNLLIILAFVFSAIIALAFHFLSPASPLEFGLLTVVAAVFISGGLVAGNSTRRNIAMMEGLRFLFARLAEDESIKFGMETMQVENGEARELSVAWHMIDELIKRIQRGNGEQKKNGGANDNAS